METGNSEPETRVVIGFDEFPSRQLRGDCFRGRQLGVAKKLPAEFPVGEVMKCGCGAFANPAWETCLACGASLSGSTANELTELVNRVANHNGFTDAERQQALTIALADHVAALECFRTLAARVPTPVIERATARPEQRKGYEYPRFTIPTPAGRYEFMMEIPKTKYDPFQILKLFEKYHGGTVH